MQTRPFPRCGLRRASFVLATLLVLGLIPKAGFAQTPISHGGARNLAVRRTPFPSHCFDLRPLWRRKLPHLNLDLTSTQSSAHPWQNSLVPCPNSEG
jgi:hypothetical protein